jgi:ribonuclease HI
MEIRAALEGLKFISKCQSNHVPFSRCAIITDSIYVFQGFKSASYWAANRWQRTEGRPIENPDTLEAGAHSAFQRPRSL